LEGRGANLTGEGAGSGWREGVAEEEGAGERCFENTGIGVVMQLEKAWRVEKKSWRVL
jgi:hypothetical protein